jgi:hypothetical protein
MDFCRALGKELLTQLIEAKRDGDWCAFRPSWRWISANSFPHPVNYLSKAHACVDVSEVVEGASRPVASVWFDETRCELVWTDSVKLQRTGGASRSSAQVDLACGSELFEYSDPTTTLERIATTILEHYAQHYANSRL